MKRFTNPLAIIKKLKKEKKPNMSHGGLHKEFVNTTAQIYMNHYGKSPNVIRDYINIAKKDFKKLQVKDIQIVFLMMVEKLVVWVLDLRYRMAVLFPATILNSPLARV